MVCFVHLDLDMWFASATACNFSFLIWPDGSAPRCFSEPIFRPSGAKNHWKNSVSRLCYLFPHLHLLSSDPFSSLIFFLLLFSSLTLPISAFHLSILSEVWLLNFLRHTQQHVICTMYTIYIYIYAFIQCIILFILCVCIYIYIIKIYSVYIPILYTIYIVQDMLGTAPHKTAPRREASSRFEALTSRVREELLLRQALPRSRGSRSWAK